VTVEPLEIGEKAAEDIGEARFGSHLFNAPGNFTASKLKWVKENEPELYSKLPILCFQVIILHLN